MRLSQRRKHQLPRPCSCECDRTTPSKKHKKLRDIHSDSPPDRTRDSSKRDEKLPSRENRDDDNPLNEIGLRKSSRLHKAKTLVTPSQRTGFNRENKTNGSSGKSPIGLDDGRTRKRVRSPSRVVDTDTSLNWDLRVQSKRKQPVVEEIKGTPASGSKGRQRQSKRKLLRDIDDCILRLDGTKNDGLLVEKLTRQTTDRCSLVDKISRDGSESDESSSSHDSSRQTLELDGGRSCELLDDEPIDTCVEHSRHSPNVLGKEEAESKENEDIMSDPNSVYECDKFIGRSDDEGTGDKTLNIMVLRQHCHDNTDGSNNLNELGMREAHGPTTGVLVTHDDDNGTVKLQCDHQLDGKNGNTVEVGGHCPSMDNIDAYVGNTMRIFEEQDVSIKEHNELVDGAENQSIKKSDMISHHPNLENHCNASVDNFAADHSTDMKQPLSCGDTEMHVLLGLCNHRDASNGSEYQHDQLDVVIVGVKNQDKAPPLDSDSEVDEHNVAFSANRCSGVSPVAERERETIFIDAEKMILSGIPGAGPKADVVEDRSTNVALGPRILDEKDKVDYCKLPSDKLEEKGWIEGRRCGLCGCGLDGKPPKPWSQDSTGSDIEAYSFSALEEPNYDIWDGFGDEPRWLGRLLGPMHDRFGIAGVWVHQHCAVWSPEVYFSGVGCLKNVRAALCRGRALKCSRCGRPGATIGCRVDRCPRTYHLPCGRADGCVFDHRKFLIACTDHRHLFQPQGNQCLQRIKKMKARKMQADMRKMAADARRKDVDGEEKWLENCGEDEEFLKREGKRLHRDISRILPIYIGGSDGESLFQGWESVAGLEHVVQCMKEVVILPLLYPEYFNKFGLTPPRGVLLHGYPGTGKTLVVRALVGACSRGEKRIAYFARKGADCLGKYVGDAERQLRLLFHVAEKCQPSIIFFDEIDGLTPVRSKHQDQTHSSVVSTLLALLDGLKSRGSVIVIGATNRPDSIDPALRRPGRFDREIYFPLPSLKDRSAILALHTQKWPKAVSGSLLWKIARETAGYAGADLQALCTQAAMIALKRNCPLQEILTAAEKCPFNGNRVSLPSFAVEEEDWLTALACASPPCSRREAGIAANDVITSPLHGDLIPCLLKPLVQLLLSLYLDKCIVLPPPLIKAGKKIKNTLLSAMEDKHSPSDLWWSNVCSLLQKPNIAIEMERNLSSIGLICGNIFFNTSENLKLDDDGCEISDICNMNVHVSGISSHTAHLLGKKKTGFRVLIAGSPRSGQKHLASCVLHGFEGNVEIHKVNLATISQEGRGDLVQGITNILLKCQRSSLCILYMPRIDLWAIDNITCESIGKETNSSSPIRTASEELGINVENSVLSASEAWNSLMGHVDSMCSTSLIILATCEMPNYVLPLRIRNFFENDMLTVASLTTSATRVPHFVVSLDGNFDWDMICDVSAEKLSRALVCLYVQIIHNKKHPTDVPMGSERFDTAGVNFPAHRSLSENQRSVDGTATGNNPEGLVSEGGKHNLAERCWDSRDCDNRLFQLEGSSVHSVQPNQESDLSVPSRRPTIKMKSLQLAIGTFGFQMLKYPHFAELCWVTSKLKEGPCTDTYGPWKGWPFNSCIVRASLSQRSIAPEDRSAKNRSVESNSVVRGLVAVGLLAYRGEYKTVWDVALDVRKVLELLVGQIRAKILEGKDRYRFMHVLSQVAYLEDMVHTWVYSTQRLELDGQILDMDSQPVFKGSTCTDACVQSRNCATEADVSKVASANWQDNHLNISEHGHMEDQKEFGPVMNSDDGAGGQLNKGANGSDASVSRIRELAASEEEMPVKMDLGCPYDPALCIQISGSDNRLQVSQTTSNEILEVDHEKHQEGNPASCEMLISKFRFSEQAKADVVSTTNYNSSNDGIAGCADLSNGNAESASKNFIPSSASSNNLCQYNCCSECLQVVHLFVREFLMTRWKSAYHTTLEDAHDIVASCTASLLAMIRELYASETNNDMENVYSADVMDLTLSNDCLCQKGSDTDTKGRSRWAKKLEMELVPTECSRHLKDKNSIKVPFLSEFKVSIRDYVVLLSDTGQDAQFHCKFEYICLYSLISQLLKIKNLL